MGVIPFCLYEGSLPKGEGSDRVASATRRGRGERISHYDTVASRMQEPRAQDGIGDRPHGGIRQQ